MPRGHLARAHCIGPRAARAEAMNVAVVGPRAGRDRDRRRARARGASRARDRPRCRARRGVARRAHAGRRAGACRARRRDRRGGSARRRRHRSPRRCRAPQVTLVCVGTPALSSGDADLGALTEACDAIGPALRRDAPPIVVVRSTVPPGTTRDARRPALAAASGLEAGPRLPCRRAAGVPARRQRARRRRPAAQARHRRAGPRRARAVVALFAPDAACIVVATTPEAAELAKYADNAWHALKVAFANEIGALARALGVDGDALMARLRARPRAQRVGRLPAARRAVRRELPVQGRRRARAAGRRAASVGAPAPRRDPAASNREHLARVVADVEGIGTRAQSGIVGLAFKPGTADLRASPYLALARALAARGRACTCGTSAWRATTRVRSGVVRALARGAGRRRHDRRLPRPPDTLAAIASRVGSRTRSST